MKLNNISLRKNEKNFLKSLLENGNKSDAQIAREIKISKATASRIRKKLEQSLISDYVPIINLDKIGISIFVVITFQWNSFNDAVFTKKTFSELKENPNVIFLANGEGSPDITSVMFLGFETLESYHEYFKNFRSKYSNHIDKMNTLLSPSKEVIKHDFTHIIKHILEVKK